MRRAWWNVCVAADRPDGPGQLVGPFPTRDLALQDIADIGENCEKGHLTIFGPGPSIAAAKRGVDPHLAPSFPVHREALEYWRAHQDEIPAGSHDYVLGLCVVWPLPYEAEVPF